MSKVTSFLLGGIIGAGLVALFSPRTGEQNRAFVAEKANAIAGEAKDFSSSFQGNAQEAYKTAREQGAAFVKDAQAKTNDFVADATSRVKEVAGKAAEGDTDDLREKIEAARQRIAAQVMENAEASKSTVADAKEAVVETVETVADKAEEAADKASDAAAEAAKPADDSFTVIDKAEAAQHAR